MAAKTFMRLATTVLVLLALFVVGCKSGGDDLDPNGVRPSISGLSKNAANIGEEIVISGLGFGLTQGESSASLNGMSFAVLAWADNQITAVVAPQMVSGIVVVTVANLSSMSGSEAQLFIPNAPTGAPIINAISPDYGEAGVDEVVITGVNFGNEEGSSAVFFQSAGAVSQTDVVQALVIEFDAGDGTMVPQWTNNSVKVTIPQGAASGEVYLVVNAEQSNGKPFTVFTGDITGPPSIAALTPTDGPVQTIVTLLGNNFGHTQGGSTLEIGEISLDIVSWTNNEILGRIPNGATTGPIRLTARGSFVETEIFTVATAPAITGVSPSAMRIGNPLTVFGSNFGAEQGTGGLRIGSTNVTTDFWSDTRIEVTSLPSISFTDKNQIPLTVTADNTLSDSTNVTMISDLDVFVDAAPTSGEAGTTVFNFFVTVTGGSGNYEYTLYPNAGNPGVTSISMNLPIPYTYTPAQVPTETTFQTQVRVEDLDTGDIAVAPGPELFVVANGQAVITGLEVLDFNHDFGVSPRIMPPYSFVFDPADPLEALYHDFTFEGDDIYFASALSDKDGLPGYTRDLGSFMSGSLQPKPYAYRYNSGDKKGSYVRIAGINFGTTPGPVYLNAGGPKIQVPDADVVGPGGAPGWTDTAIDFRMPANVGSDLSGIVTVDIGGTEISSMQRLICSPSLNAAQPNPVLLNGTLALTGFDLQPPIEGGITGPDTYLIWIVQATYDDPFDPGVIKTGAALLTEPIKVDPVGSTINFSMSNLTPGRLIEILSPFGDQALLTPIISYNETTALTNYEVFLWTGVLDDGEPLDIANSGIFSEAIPVKVGAGAGTFTVSGTVTNKVPPNGGVAGCTMTLTPGGYQASTGGSGGFTITGVPAGNYTLTPTGADGDFDPATRAVAVTTANITGQDFQVTDSGGGPGPDVTVTGRCFDDVTGDGIGDVLVRFFHDGTPPVFETTTTNPDGTYSIVVAEWDYDLNASKPTWAFAVEPPNTPHMVIVGDTSGVDFRGVAAGGG